MKEKKTAEKKPAQFASQPGTAQLQAPEFGLSASPIQRQTPPGADDPFEVPWQDTNISGYDRLSGYNNGSNGRTLNQIDYIVLHSTGGSRTLNSVDAHFEVAPDGQIFLANQVDKGCPHAGHRWQNQAGHPLNTYANMNTRSLGIEFVNDYHTLRNQPSGAGDTAGVAAMRAEIRGLDLSPQFKARLVGMSDAALYNEMRGTGYIIYEDINAQQKMAAYEMQRNMQQDYPDAEFIAHEHVSPKKVGEGENIQEFLETITAYNTKLQTLLTAAPEFWSREDARQITLQDKAEAAMGRVQFFEQFYAINARLDRIIALMGRIASSPTSSLMQHLTPDGEESTGMNRILGDFKNHFVEKTVLNRNFKIDFSVISSQDWAGGEEVFIEFNGETISSTVDIATGGSHSFVFSNRKLASTLNASNQFKIMESDDLSYNDLLMNLNWNPMANPAGVSRSNANYSARISFA